MSDDRPSHADLEFLRGRLRAQNETIKQLQAQNEELGRNLRAQKVEQACFLMNYVDMAEQLGCGPSWSDAERIMHANDAGMRLLELAEQEPELPFYEDWQLELREYVRQHPALRELARLRERARLRELVVPTPEDNE